MPLPSDELEAEHGQPVNEIQRKNKPSSHCVGDLFYVFFIALRRQINDYPFFPFTICNFAFIIEIIDPMMV